MLCTLTKNLSLPLIRIYLFSFRHFVKGKLFIKVAERIWLDIFKIDLLHFLPCIPINTHLANAISPCSIDSDDCAAQRCTTFFFLFCLSTQRRFLLHSLKNVFPRGNQGLTLSPEELLERWRQTCYTKSKLFKLSVAITDWAFLCPPPQIYWSLAIIIAKLETNIFLLIAMHKYIHSELKERFYCFLHICNRRVSVSNKIILHDWLKMCFFFNLTLYYYRLNSST